MLSWSLKRRFIYIIGTLTFFAIVLGWFAFVTLYQPATCFDGKQNQNEAGIDCGGSCAYYCESQVGDSIILFSRSFEVAEGIYNAVAYVENPNFNIGTRSVEYKFTLLDSNNQIIAERTGRTFIASGRISPIFEGGILTDGSVPVRTFFEFTSEPKWIRVEGVSESPFVIKNKVLSDVDTKPRIDATLENTSILELREFEVVVVVFNALGNAIASSRTFVESLPKRTSIDLVYTWPKPLTKELEACVAPVDVMLLIDTSGSMNEDNVDPPQPLTDAKNAASDFISRLTQIDRSGITTFATEATVHQKFTAQHNATRNAVDELYILPEEETGFTNMGSAIREAISELSILNKVKKNGESNKVLVILTDGKSNAPEDPGGEPYALEQARIAKDSGYSVYTIGLGEEVNTAFLKEVASKDGVGRSKLFYKAEESEDLSGIYETISDAICEHGPAIIEIIPRIPDTVI